MKAKGVKCPSKRFSSMIQTIINTSRIYFLTGFNKIQMMNTTANTIMHSQLAKLINQGTATGDRC